MPAPDTLAASLYRAVLNDILTKVEGKFVAHYGESEAARKLEALAVACRRDMSTRGVPLTESLVPGTSRDATSDIAAATAAAALGASGIEPSDDPLGLVSPYLPDSGTATATSAATDAGSTSTQSRQRPGIDQLDGGGAGTSDDDSDADAAGSERTSKRPRVDAGVGDTDTGAHVNTGPGEERGEDSKALHAARAQFFSSHSGGGASAEEDEFDGVEGSELGSDLDDDDSDLDVGGGGGGGGGEGAIDGGDSERAAGDALAASQSSQAKPPPGPRAVSGGGDSGDFANTLLGQYARVNKKDKERWHIKLRRVLLRVNCRLPAHVLPQDGVWVQVYGRAAQRDGDGAGGSSGGTQKRWYAARVVGADLVSGQLHVEAPLRRPARASAATGALARGGGGAQTSMVRMTVGRDDVRVTREHFLPSCEAVMVFQDPE